MTKSEDYISLSSKSRSKNPLKTLDKSSLDAIVKKKYKKLQKERCWKLVRKNETKKLLKNDKKNMSSTEMKNYVLDKYRHVSLFVRYLHSKPPSREEIRKLHPNIVDVRYPRQKSARFCHIEFESKTAALQAEKEIKETHKEVVVRYLAEARDFDSHKPSKTQSQKSKSLQLNASKHKKKAKSNTHTPDPETTSGECVSSLKQEDIQHKKSPQKKKGKKPVDSIEKIEKAKTNVMDEKQGTKNSNVNDSLEPTTCIHVSGLPDLAVKEILQSVYPKNKTISIFDKKINGKRQALVHFNSIEEATRAVEATKDVSVNGDMLSVGFHK